MLLDFTSSKRDDLEAGIGRLLRRVCHDGGRKQSRDWATASTREVHLYMMLLGRREAPASSDMIDPEAGRVAGTTNEEPHLKEIDCVRRGG